MKNKIKFCLTIGLVVIITVNFGCGSREKKNLEISERIFAAFGEGANGQGMLEEYLELTLHASRSGNTWTYTNSSTNKTFQIGISSSQRDLAGALAADNAYVVFDGHANFGIGPNFPNDFITKLSDFFNIGTQYTGINWKYIRESRPPRTLPLEIDDSAIPSSVSNYRVPIIQQLKFKNDDLVRSGGTFTLKGSGYDRYHYSDKGNLFLIVNAGSSDLPITGLQYKVCFMNSCSSGRHYIETLNHGTLFYTKEVCSDIYATKEFVKGIIEDKTYKQIEDDLNNGSKVFEFYTF